MKNTKFKIHADLDGYLDDPIIGSLNEKLYETILDVSEPNYADGRLYSLSRTPYQVMSDAYRLLNKMVLERHPEDSFKNKYLKPLKDEYADTHYAHLVFSVVYVVSVTLSNRQYLRISYAIDRCMSTESSYFRVFQKLAQELEGEGLSIDYESLASSETDWHYEYDKLHVKYQDLKHAYEELLSPPIKEKDNQLRLSLDMTKDDYVSVHDLISIARDSNTSDLFQVLRITLAQSNGDLLELVKTNQESFTKHSDAVLVSNLATTKAFSKTNVIRLFRALYDAKKITTRDGSKLTYTDYFNTIGAFLDIDLSDANAEFSNTMGSGFSDEANTEIFRALADVIIKQNNKR